jgi:predicted RNA binding protein YcfA (HicA-like mRNA interferase family)
MKAISGKEMCKLLEKNGWELKNINGSHHIYMKPGRRERISVPVHANKSLKIGLQNAILKLTGIK